ERVKARARLRAQAPRAPKPAIWGSKHQSAAAVMSGGVAILLVDGYWSVLAGVVAAAAAYIVARRVTTEQEDRERRLYAQQLPFALEAFAACLKTGASAPQALGWAAEAVGGR